MPSSSDAFDQSFASAYSVAALAGAVDAIAVVAIGDTFVSFMSGNTTLLGSFAARGGVEQACRLLLIVLAFVSSVAASELLAVRIAPSRRTSVLLALVSAMLFLSAVLVRFDVGHFVVTLGLSSAMGVLNASVRRAGGMEVALTYVTGTLVRFGRAIAAVILGRLPWQDAAPMLLLWISFAFGAFLGGWLASFASFGALWVVAVWAGIQAVLTAHLLRGDCA